MQSRDNKEVDRYRWVTACHIAVPPVKHGRALTAEVAEGLTA